MSKLPILLPAALDGLYGNFVPPLTTDPWSLLPCKLLPTPSRKHRFVIGLVTLVGSNNGRSKVLHSLPTILALPEIPSVTLFPLRKIETVLVLQFVDVANDESACVLVVLLEW